MKIIMISLVAAMISAQASASCGDRDNSSMKPTAVTYASLLPTEGKATSVRSTPAVAAKSADGTANPKRK